MIELNFKIKKHKFYLYSFSGSFITYKSKHIDNVSYDLEIYMYKPIFKDNFKIGYINIIKNTIGEFNASESTRLHEFVYVTTEKEIKSYIENMLT